jgi:hypothetical protein
MLNQCVGQLTDTARRRSKSRRGRLALVASFHSPNTVKLWARFLAHGPDPPVDREHHARTPRHDRRRDPISEIIAAGGTDPQEFLVSVCAASLGRDPEPTAMTAPGSRRHRNRVAIGVIPRHGGADAARLRLHPYAVPAAGILPARCRPQAADAANPIQGR